MSGRVVARVGTQKGTNRRLRLGMIFFLRYIGQIIFLFTLVWDDGAKSKEKRVWMG
jgi:hypothetical protein